jgi:hypothetical protein
MFKIGTANLNKNYFQDHWYFGSDQFCLVAYWEIHWRTRQYLFEQEALFLERELQMEEAKITNGLKYIFTSSSTTGEKHIGEK